jgi:hypothetical protein
MVKQKHQPLPPLLTPTISKEQIDRIFQPFEIIANSNKWHLQHPKLKQKTISIQPKRLAI